MLHPRPAPAAEQKSGVPLLCGLALAVAVSCVLVWLFMPSYKAVADSESQCPSDIAAVTAVLIDVTDPLSGEQKDRVLNEMEILCKNLPQYGRLDLYCLDKEQVAQRIFSRCNPGDGADVHWFFLNHEMAQNKWREQFFNKVQAALKQAVECEGTVRSPIIEAINAVCARSFSGRSGATPGGSSLILVSDMLHNTNELNHYKRRNSQNFQEFSQKPYYSSTRPTNMAGVRSLVYYVRRPKHGSSQGQEHKEFWRAYFAACGSTVQFEEI